MAKTKEKKGVSVLRHGKNRIVAAIFALFAVCLLISLVSFDSTALHSAGSLELKQTGNHESVALFGEFGNFLAYYNFAFMGISSWLIPWLLVTISYVYFTRTSIIVKWKKISSLIMMVVSVSTLANINFSSSADAQNYVAGWGGYLGAFVYSGLPVNPSAALPTGLLGNLLGPLGTSIACVIGLFFSITIYFSRSLNWSKKMLTFSVDLLTNVFQSKKKTAAPVPEEKTEIKSKESKFKRFLLETFKFGGRDDDLLFSDVSKGNNPNGQVASNNKISKKEVPIKDVDDNLSKPTQDQDLEKIKEPEIVKRMEEEPEMEVKINEGLTDQGNEAEKKDVEMDGFKVVRAAKTEKAGDLFPERKGDYHFPTLELLMEPPDEVGNEDEDHMVKAKSLKETLAQFKVDIELGEVHTGPVITRYDVHPAAGVRVEKISNLDKNLAMALRADSVRILAPVPGKGCVGIEVPNQNPAAVCLKEILQSKAWADSGAEIPIVLGKEASGRALVADLTKMPHLLVAGSTGSGKTVCINAIIASLCYHSSPEDVRFIMVDPKIVEMKIYNDLPHMLIPVVTEPKKVPGALKWLLVEMERRYQIFSKIGVRNIAGFNAKILKDKQEKEKAQLLDAEMTAEERAALSNIQVPRDDEVLEIPENKLPYIVCIIDELADLMMVAQADVETGIARLAQLARAAGIHLIIATQRPSVNVITGVIKANLPSRISFRVASYRDSQTILDGKGAEALIGKGDMLFTPPGSSTFVRAQGAFVSDEEINGIVDYLKINGPPQIIEEVRYEIESAGEEDVLGESGEGGDEDPMIRKAIEVIRTTKRASTSNLQRKLSIGYNRAARIMDELEDRGLVGPDIPGQGREIQMDL